MVGPTLETIDADDVGMVGADWRHPVLFTPFFLLQAVRAPRVLTFLAIARRSVVFSRRFARLEGSGRQRKKKHCSSQTK